MTRRLYRRASSLGRRGGLGHSYFNKLWKMAKKEFGTTEDPACAGYMLPDGDMLNFCTEGGWERDLDHRAIKPVIEEALDMEYEDRSDAMNAFIAAGAIRMGVYRDNISLDFSKQPTPEQRAALRHVLPMRREVRIDVTRPDTGTVEVWKEWGGAGQLPAQADGIIRWMSARGYEGLGKHRGLAGPIEDAAFEKACSAAGIPTRDFGEAGFLLPNGCVVEVAGGHADIAKYYPPDEMNPRLGPEEAVHRSITNGAIRLWRVEEENALALELHKKPTEAQMRELQILLRDVDALYLDVRMEGGVIHAGQSMVTHLDRSNRGEILRRLRLVGYEGLGQHVAYPAGTPEGRLKWHYDPYRFKRALKQAEKCGPVSKECSTDTTVGGHKITTCVWRSRGQVIAAAAGTATGEGKFSWSSRGTSFWSDRELLEGKCPRERE